MNEVDLDDASLVLDAARAMMFDCRFDDEHVHGIVQRNVETGRPLSPRQLEWVRSEVYAFASKCICKVDGCPIEIDDIPNWLDSKLCGQHDNNFDRD